METLNINFREALQGLSSEELRLLGRHTNRAQGRAIKDERALRGELVRNTRKKGSTLADIWPK